MITTIKISSNKKTDIRIELEDIEELLFIDYMSENIELSKAIVEINDTVNGTGPTVYIIDYPVDLVELKRYAIKNINHKFKRITKDTSFGAYIHYVSINKLMPEPMLGEY